MILTGKALEDFNKWNYDNDFGYIDHEPTSLIVHFENLDENLRHTIITDWLDSIGIYIEVNLFLKNTEDGTECTFKSFVNNEIVQINHHFGCYDSRQDAIEGAINKANLIYNELF